jgi:DNA-binding response OmpR family regulator
MNAANLDVSVLDKGMSNIDTINHIVSTASPVLHEVVGPTATPQFSGVLVIAGSDMRFAVNRVQQPVRKRRDVRVNSLTDAYIQLLTQRFDLVLILQDVSEANEELVLARLRDLASGAPVLVLSDRALSDASVAGSKESQREISDSKTGVENLVRPQTVAVGPIVGYRASGMIMVNDEPLKLSPSLSRILWRLLEAPQNHCKMSELVDAMTNPEFPSAKDTLRVHICRLRSKLAAAGCGGVLVAGRGVYWLRWPQSE